MPGVGLAVGNGSPGGQIPSCLRERRPPNNTLKSRPRHAVQTAYVQEKVVGNTAMGASPGGSRRARAVRIEEGRAV